MKNYGYLRCSTSKKLGKQDTARQKRDIKNMCKDSITFFEDYASGSKVNRVEYKAMLKVIEEEVKSGESDVTIYCTEVSRLSRSMQQLIDLMSFVEQNHVRLVCGGFVLDCRIVDNQTGKIDPMAEAMLQMMGIFAQLERKITIDRINSALSLAKENGTKLGRPTTTIEDVPKVFTKYYDDFKTGKYNVTEMAKLCRCSRTSIYKYKKILEAKQKEIKI